MLEYWEDQQRGRDTDRQVKRNTYTICKRKIEITEAWRCCAQNLDIICFLNAPESSSVSKFIK